MKVGIFIGRMQPIHIGHQRIIEKSIEENDFTFIILGSSRLIDINNPFTNEERVLFVENIFVNRNKYKIFFLEDNESDEKWVRELDLLILEKSNLHFDRDIERVIFYGGDLENDYAIRVIKDFEHLLKVKKIEYKEISRKEIIISHKGNKFHISSTKVREELKKSNYEMLDKMLSKSVIEYLKNNNS